MKASYIKVYLLFFIHIILSGCKHNPVEKYYYVFPAGYEGPAFVIFNQEDGILPEVENEIKVFNFSETGYLKVKEKAKSTWIVESVFTYDSKGKRTKIPSYDNVSQLDTVNKDRVIAFGFIRGSDTNPANNQPTIYESFCISKVKYLDSILNKRERFSFSIFEKAR